MDQEFFNQQARADNPVQLTMRQKLYPKMEVEACFALSIGTMGRNLLHLDKNGNPKKGRAYVASKYDRMLIAFKVIPGEPYKVKVCYPYKDEAKTQVINILTKPLRFGNKPFFFCVMCGSLRSKLYLRPDRAVNYFSCRKCLELTYELQAINPRGGIMAELSYRMNRAVKVDAMLKRSKRKVYGDKVAKPFWRWAVAREKWMGKEAVIQTYTKMATAGIEMS